MKAENLQFGQKIRMGGNNKAMWTILGIDLNDKRFCYIKSDKNGEMKRVTINRIQPIR